MNIVTLIDCMDYMKNIPDKFYELAIVDPPYGININMNQGRRSGEIKKHANKRWDSKPPTSEYFVELERISKARIIWGANNFSWIPPHNGWIVWDKDITGDVQFSKAELAYCSLSNTVNLIKIRAQTGNETYSNKIHPTQKPVALYKWLLQNYAKTGDKIFDSHVGSGSIRIACYDMGFDFVGCELDEDYWKAQEERFAEHTQQGDLFSGSDLQPFMIGTLQ